MRKYKAGIDTYADDPDALEEYMQEKIDEDVPPGTFTPSDEQILTPPDDHIDNITSSGIERPSPGATENGEENGFHVVTEEKTDSDTAKAIIALMGKDDLRMQSEMTRDEVRAVTVLNEIADTFQSERMKKFVEHHLANMVSHNRGSRKEVVDSFPGLKNIVTEDAAVEWDQWHQCRSVYNENKENSAGDLRSR